MPKFKTGNFLKVPGKASLCLVHSHSGYFGARLCVPVDILQDAGFVSGVLGSPVMRSLSETQSPKCKQSPLIYRKLPTLQLNWVSDARLQEQCWDHLAWVQSESALCVAFRPKAQGYRPRPMTAIAPLSTLQAPHSTSKAHSGCTQVEGRLRGVTDLQLLILPKPQHLGAFHFLLILCST